MECIKDFFVNYSKMSLVRKYGLEKSEKKSENLVELILRTKIREYKMLVTYKFQRISLFHRKIM